MKVKIIGKIPKIVASTGVVLEASASELTQGLGGWKFEGYTVPAKLK